MCLACLVDQVLVYSKKVNNHDLTCPVCDVVFMNTEHINNKSDIYTNFEIDQNILNVIEKIKQMISSRKVKH